MDIPEQVNEGGQTNDEFNQGERGSPTHEPSPYHPPHITHPLAHTALYFSNCSAGTSSGCQSQEKYNYVVIRTVLDDVLHELQ